MVLKQARNPLHTSPSPAELDEATQLRPHRRPRPAPPSHGPRAGAAAPDIRTAPRRGHAAVRLGLRDKPKAVASAVVALLAVGGFLFAMSLFDSSLSLSSGDPQGPGTVPINLPPGFTRPPLTPSATARPPAEPPKGSGGSPSAAAQAVLREGDSGQLVRELQSLLHQISGLYGAGTGETDGRYDAGVAQAVARFQSAVGISGETPGVYGPVTQYALETRVRQQAVSPAPSQPETRDHEHEEGEEHA
ncbi:peptidoglycan-binding domain-containing protein [Streptomyces sp. NPDC048385]|uniref:peptidoglycan-binding domain-containing protein n=1 Tax=unclassified Streptomyces TaxID=2593676 RepID=UPI00341A5DCB